LLQLPKRVKGRIVEEKKNGFACVAPTRELGIYTGKIAIRSEKNMKLRGVFGWKPGLD